MARREAHYAEFYVHYIQTSVYSLRIVFLLRWMVSEPWHFRSVTINTVEEMTGPGSWGSSSWIASTTRFWSTLREVSSSERARSMAVSGSRNWNLISVAKG